MTFTDLQTRQTLSKSIFWGEISPCEHVVEFYSDDNAYLDSLEGFVVGGLRKGDSVIVIATGAHRKALDERLAAYGVNVREAQARDQYIALDAEETLAKFMVNGWPDEELFQMVVSDLLLRARRGGRSVRAFGEMVALMWARGQNGATVRLEHLWHRLCHEKSFSLFCAYPKSGFTQSPAASIKEICSAHSRAFGELN
jgi:hypothetical protein